MGESDAWYSSAALFTTGPRFAAGAHPPAARRLT